MTDPRCKKQDSNGIRCGAPTGHDGPCRPLGKRKGLGAFLTANKKSAVAKRKAAKKGGKKAAKKKPAKKATAKKSRSKKPAAKKASKPS